VERLFLYCLTFLIFALVFLNEPLLPSLAPPAQVPLGLSVGRNQPLRVQLVVPTADRAENLSPAMGRGIDSRNRVWN
jgi:hypothetical protein